MKLKKLILIAVGSFFITSCMKTYVCKDTSTGISTGEVKAMSNSKAKAMCPGGHATLK